MKKTICLDFDGVIHSYTSGWKGAAEIPDPPVPGAFEALEKYLKHFKVAIYSSRSGTASGNMAMRVWFVDHGFKYTDELEFPEHKPPAWVTIDDRGITFNGTFPSVQALNDFRPWYQKE